MRLSARIAWRLASWLSPLTFVFTWDWLVWWTAALMRFATTGTTFTVTRKDEGAALLAEGTRTR